MYNIIIHVYKLYTPGFGKQSEIHFVDTLSVVYNTAKITKECMQVKAIDGGVD